MISFVTISRDDNKVGALNKNINTVFNTVFNTGGYELLVADGNVESIFTGYNKMAEEAKGEYFCFLHDDIRLLCNRECFDKPLELMDKPFTGILSPAGSISMPSDGCWWHAPQEDCRGAVFHSNNDEVGMHLNMWPWQVGRFGRVVICDGVMLMVSRKTFDKIGGFNENDYKGFHGYDISISTEAHLKGYQNFVMPIPILHASPGHPNEEWKTNIGIYVEKYKKHLPLKI